MTNEEKRALLNKAMEEGAAVKWTVIGSNYGSRMLTEVTAIGRDKVLGVLAQDLKCDGVTEKKGTETFLVIDGCNFEIVEPPVTAEDLVDMIEIYEGTEEVPERIAMYDLAAKWREQNDH